MHAAVFLSTILWRFNLISLNSFVIRDRCFRFDGSFSCIVKVILKLNLTLNKRQSKFFPGESSQ